MARKGQETESVCLDDLTGLARSLFPLPLVPPSISLSPFVPLSSFSLSFFLSFAFSLALSLALSLSLSLSLALSLARALSLSHKHTQTSDTYM